MKRPRERATSGGNLSRPVVTRQGRVLEVFPISMFEQARQVRGFIVLPGVIEREAVGVTSSEERALEGHKPYMKLINVLNRKAVTEMRHTNSVATVVYHALKQQTNECRPLLRDNQDIAFGIALTGFVATGQHSRDSSFFLLSQIVQTQPAPVRPKNRRQETSCGTWTVCCILKTQTPPISLDFRPMGGMTIIYDATTLAQEYDRYITRGAQCRSRNAPLILSPKRLCTSFPLKSLTPTTVMETPLITSSPADKSVEEKEDGGTINLLSLLNTCDDKAQPQDSQQMAEASAIPPLPGIQCLLQDNPDHQPLPPISSFSST